jgi:glycine cleavage system transcriptional repressor
MFATRVATRAVTSLNVAFMSTAAASAGTTRRAAVVHHSLVLMTSGPDDKDILSLVSGEVAKLGGNLEESRMTGLGGDFSLVSLVTIPNTVTPDVISEAITSALPGFTVAARPTSPTPPSAGIEPSKVLSLDIEGPDQPKIVAKFSDILFKHGVSIKDVITDTSSAPFLGYNIFAMKSVIAVPVKSDMNALETELQKFEEEFGLSLSVSDPADQGQEQQQQQE